MKSIKYISLISLVFFCFLFSNSNYAQESQTDISKMTKEEILKMSYDDLLELPFEDLMKLAEIVGVSADELLELILNMNVSTASKKVETVFESPLSTTVIPKEEIEQSGATTIEELFRLVPGMIVREKSNGNFDVHTRGNDNVPPGNFNHFSENSMTLVMVDNRIVYNYINGGTFWETLPIGLEDIERVDIIRGPSSALYGPNAVSGVINFITKKPENNTLKLNGNIQAGSLNTNIASLSASAGLNDKLTFRFSGNYEKRDRSQETYYSYASGLFNTTGEYLVKDSMRSIFNYPNEFYITEADKLPTPSLAKEKYAGNAFIIYDLNDKINCNISGGLQNSEIQTVFFETLATPFSNRKSKTGYIDFKTNIYGFSGQISYMGGEQDLSVGMVSPVIKYDMKTLNANLEYNFNYENFNLRPGIGYQKATYDDANHVENAKLIDPIREGLLNGEQSLSNFSLNLRADYTAFDKLRLIAAIRNDKYDKPDANYFSYQFISSFNLNKKHILRVVYSRANRGAFIGDVYARFQNALILAQDIDDLAGLIGLGLLNPDEPLYYQYYMGNENIKLLTMDLLEFGHRWKITDNLQTDIEIFYTKAQDFDALIPTSLTDSLLIDLGTDQVNATHEIRSYENLELISKQTGISASINYMPTKKLLLKFFGTYQKTNLENHMPNESNPTNLVDEEHKWTPSFYGGLSVNYTPIENLNIFSNTYFYTEQTYSRYQSPILYETSYEVVSAKAIANLKISYKFWEENSIYFNARNVFNATDREFGFTDNIKGLYLVGLNVNF